jgi:AcrR family transcriptional regulator
MRRFPSFRTRWIEGHIVKNEHDVAKIDPNAKRGASPPARRGAAAPKRLQRRSAVTQDSLIAAARQLFADVGYHAAGTHDLVAMTSVTRGALYHHFSDKKALFEAVLRQIAAELSRTASQTVAPYSGDPWRQLKSALRAYLELVALRPDAQRVLLIDGPAVLGWDKWRAIRSEITLPGLIYTLELLMENGTIKRQPKEPMAQLILAAVNEAALAIAHAPEPAKAQQSMTKALLNLIEGLRVP